MWARKGVLWVTCVVRTDVSQLIFMPPSLPRVAGFSAARRRRCLQSTNKRVDKQRRTKMVTIKQEKKVHEKFVRQDEKRRFSLWPNKEEIRYILTTLILPLPKGMIFFNIKILKTGTRMCVWVCVCNIQTACYNQIQNICLRSPIVFNSRMTNT